MNTDAIKSAVVVLIGVGLIAGFIWLLHACAESDREQLKESYEAWCKHTGNSNKLSFSEWDSLDRPHRPSTTYIPIFIPTR